MSWSRVLATGGGVTRYRLEIEGFRHMAVTDSAMVLSDWGDGRRTAVGLLREGLVISDVSILHEGRVEGEPMTVRIVDVGGVWTEAFSTHASTLTWLTASATAAAGSLTVADNTQFNNGSRYHINTETFTLNTKTGSTVLNVTRGVWGTTAQAHPIESGARAIQPEVSDRPFLLAGRRATLYAYGSKDSPTGSGTTIWRGVVSGEPRISSDGTTWELPLDSIASILEQTIVGLDEAPEPRGVYYPFTAPLVLLLQEHSGSTSDTSVANSATVKLANFYETQTEFLAALNTKIAAAIGGWTSATIRAEADGNDGWHFVINSGASARFAMVARGSGSLCDGFIIEGLKDASGLDKDTVGTSTGYFQYFPNGGGRVPRRNGAGHTSITAVSDDTAASTAPHNRLHLATVSGVATGDMLTQTTDDEEIVRNWEITTVSATNSYVEVDVPTTARGPSAFISFGDHADVPDLKITKRFGTGPTNLEGFRSALASAAANSANAGTHPFVLAADLTSWATPVAEAAAGRPFLQQRDYVFGKSVQLSDVLEHECRLYSLCPRIEANGTIGMFKITTPAATRSSTSIGKSRQLVDQAFAELDVQAQGLVSSVKIKTGYDPAEDKWRGREYEVRYIPAISRVRRHRPLEIEPRVNPAAPTLVEYENYLDIAWPLLIAFGNRYSVIHVGVPITLFGTIVGDVVSCTLSHVPHNGGRGLSGVIGTVVGRRWDLDAGRGVLSIMIHTLNVAGYTPTGRIEAGPTDNGGNNWTLLIDTSVYGEGPDADAVAGFIAGDVVRAVEWDDAAPNSLTGTVESVTPPHEIVVQFDGAWTFSGSTNNLIYKANGGDWTDNQLRYCEIADSTRKRDDGSAARVFS